MALESGKHSYAEKPMAVNFEDGRSALIIANAAYESMEYKKSIKINYDK